MARSFKRNYSSALQSRSASKEPPTERLKRRASFTLERITGQSLPWTNSNPNSTPVGADDKEVEEGAKGRPNRSFSGFGSVKSGIGSKLRRTSESIKSRFHPSTSRSDSAAGSSKRRPPSPAGSTMMRSDTRRSRTTTSGGDLTAQLAALSLTSPSLERDVSQSLTVSRDPSRGAAARASAARENQRNNTPKTISRRDSNVGISRVERSRESGISMQNETSSAADMRARRDSHVLRVDPLAYLPTELNSLILSFLDAGSLSKASVVSKNWRRMTSDPHIWRTIFLRRFGQPSSVSSPPSSVGGKGIGKCSRTEQDWRKMYKARHDLASYWNRGDPTAVYLRGHTDSVYCLQFDEDKIITGSRDRTIRVWNIRTFKCVKVIGIPSAYSNDCREFGNAEDQLPTVQAMTYYQAPVEEPDPLMYHVPSYFHQASILCLQYDDEIVVTGSSDNTLIVWDLATWQPLRRLIRHRSGVLDVAFDKQKIVSCSKDASLCIWDRASGELLQQLTGHRGPVNAVQLRGNLIVSASGEGCARLWNLTMNPANPRDGSTSAKCIKEFWSRDRGLACVEFSADAKYILAGGNDQVVYKFDTSTGETVATLRGHENLVRSLYLDGANGRIVSGSYDLSLRVWDFETGELLARFADATTSWLLAAKSDYRRIVCTSQDGRVVVLDFGCWVGGVELLEG